LKKSLDSASEIMAVL